MLRATRDVPLRFLRRSQGLILPRGNPRRVRTLADVARKGLRFVNRQPGSGTRLLLDQLLARVGLRPADVDGYERFMRASEATYKVGFEQLGHVPFSSWTAMARVVPAMIRLGSHRTIHALAARHVKDERLRFALKGAQPGQIAQLCLNAGLQILSLKRIRIGRVSMAKLPPGQWRYLPADQRF